MKQFLFKIAKTIVLYLLDYLYNIIDKDKDGKISKKELDIFYYKIKELRKKR